MADEHEMTEPGTTGPEAAQEAPEEARKLKARDLNELINYTMWSVYRVRDRVALEAGGHGNAAAEVTELLDQAESKGVVTRGSYDIQGLRADADFMFWWVSPNSDDLRTCSQASAGPGSAAAASRSGR
jgi:chlorite dismutase